MFGDHFYHERTRKSVAIFGSLFNNIYIIRRHGSKVLGQIKVPVAYAPQRKFLERIAEMNAGGDDRIEDMTAIRLPRMSFEISNYQYDAARQLPKSNYIKCDGEGDKSDPCGATSYQVYGGTPYNLTFELNIYGKQHDDCLQCVEQIIPYFNPQYTVSMKPLAGMSDIVEDVPITLQSVTFQDNFEGALEDRRIIIYTLTFEMKVMFYGPVNKTPKKVIETIDIDFFNDWPSAFSPQQDPDYLETLRIDAVPHPSYPPDSDTQIVIDILNEHSPDSDFTHYEGDSHDVPHPYK